MVDISLHQMIECGDLCEVEKMIASGTDLHELDDAGLTPLAKSVELGHIEIVQVLLLAGAHIDYGGIFSPLHIACGEGYIEIVKLLLKNGAITNILDENDGTPLMWAAAAGNLEIVQLLIDSGADVSIRDNIGQTALTCAEVNQHQAIVELLSSLMRENLQEAKEETQSKLIEIKPSSSCSLDLIHAAKNGNLDQVQTYVSQKIDINATGLDDNTALFWASSRGHVEIVRALIDAEAEIDAGVDRKPIAVAAEKGNLEIVELLLQAGADSNYRDSSGYTPLMYAQEQGHWSLVELLQKKKETS